MSEVLNGQRVKKQPIRRCAGCNEHFPKNELIRVLRTPQSEIVLDMSGKQSGRGVYICKNPSCLKKARKYRRFETSLECSIPDQVYERLIEEISTVE